MWNRPNIIKKLMPFWKINNDRWVLYKKLFKKSNLFMIYYRFIFQIK